MHVLLVRKGCMVSELRQLAPEELPFLFFDIDFNLLHFGEINDEPKVLERIDLVKSCCFLS